MGLFLSGGVFSSKAGAFYLGESDVMDVFPELRSARATRGGGDVAFAHDA